MFMRNLKKRLSLLVDVVELVLDVDDVDVVLLVEVEDEELVKVVVVVVLVPELKREEIFYFHVYDKSQKSSIITCGCCRTCT
jgi:hypothetical protein